ncbi:hypothetical protein [Lysinibacillus sp. fls2-241-R2A-57]|uniref:hypothetical protein n=1 Tax=Lysinibacillus sp. fls2-241-R2A-57 TaxID=3040292 RepID=UPI002552D26A|nr:hypothetical protein [Lysinibacillus sp. fls2-241-R2A-57]
MAIKMNDEKILKFLEMIKPKIKKELLQANFQDREDLEQELTLFIVKFLKENEFEEVDFLNCLNKAARVKWLIGRPQEALLSAKAKRQQQMFYLCESVSVSNKCFICAKA